MSFCLKKQRAKRVVVKRLVQNASLHSTLSTFMMQSYNIPQPHLLFSVVYFDFCGLMLFSVVFCCFLWIV